MIYIIKRYTCAVCYHSEKSGTISEAVKEAHLSGPKGRLFRLTD